MRVSLRTVALVSLSSVGLLLLLLVLTWHPSFEKQSTAETVETGEAESWISRIEMPEYLDLERSAVPNGGLVIDEKSLWWGDVWETEQPLYRDLILKNPTDRDLHLRFVRYPCGFFISNSLITVPAHGTFALQVGVYPSARWPSAREEFLVKQKTFAPAIEEFPGRHPGWTVHCHVTRAMTIDEQNELFIVTPLRELSAVTASVNGQRVGVAIEGPDESNRYLVSLDRDALRKVPSEDRFTRLQIRGHLPFGAVTDRQFWIDR